MSRYYFSKRATTLAGIPNDSERWRQQESRDRQLEYYLNLYIPITPCPIFSYPGPLASDTSGPWESRYHSGVLLGGVAKLGTSGSTTTTVNVKKNGTTVLTFTLASSATRDAQRLTTPIFILVEFDNLTCELSAAGTGAEDLVVILDVIPQDRHV